MKLISELVEETSFLTETREDGKKEYFIEGPFISMDKLNKNGRIYREEIMEPEVNRYIREMVASKRAFGELGHPQGPTINLDRVCHIVTEMKKDGKFYIGKAKLTETPMGEIVKGLLNSGGQVGVSTRGLGSIVEKNGVMEVQKDFKLACVDVVGDPSGYNCFVNGIMENVDWVYDPVKGSWHEQKLDDIKKQIHGMSKSQLEEQKIALIEDYFASLAVKDYLI